MFNVYFRNVKFFGKLLPFKRNWKKHEYLAIKCELWSACLWLTRLTCVFKRRKLLEWYSEIAELYRWSYNKVSLHKYYCQENNHLSGMLCETLKYFEPVCLCCFIFTYYCKSYYILKFCISRITRVQLFREVIISRDLQTKIVYFRHHSYSFVFEKFAHECQRGVWIREKVNLQHTRENKNVANKQYFHTKIQRFDCRTHFVNIFLETVVCLKYVNVQTNAVSMINKAVLRMYTALC